MATGYFKGNVAFITAPPSVEFCSALKKLSFWNCLLKETTTFQLSTSLTTGILRVAAMPPSHRVHFLIMKSHFGCSCLESPLLSRLAAEVRLEDIKIAKMRNGVNIMCCCLRGVSNTADEKNRSRFRLQ